MIKEKLDQVQRKNITDTLDISPKTLYNWENNKHIEMIMKYIELCKLLKICPYDMLEIYKQKNSTDE